MITDCYDISTEPMISLKDFYGEKKHLLDKCLIILSKKIHEYLLENYECTEIAALGACNGMTPIYRINTEGEEIAFYLSSMGSTGAATECVEANWITGATQFIMFGSCGSLMREVTAGKYIIPTESYRGEGCSYYYAPPAEYISIKNSHKVAALFAEWKTPYVQGKVWTTDSMLRETAGLVNQRKSEGCIAVEMELAGVQAVCDFYGLELYNFLEAGDVLSESGYEVEGLYQANHDLAKLHLALKMIKAL